MLFIGHADLDSAMGAINEGSVFRLLLKPCKPEQLLSTLQASVDQHRLITAEKTLLDKTLRGSVRVLADILGAVNPVAFSRSSRTKDRCCRMATSLGLRDLWQVEVAALLSQIGCATIPPKILDRKLMGEALSDAEEKLYREHPKAGARLLQEIPRLEPVAQAIAQQMASQPPPSKLAGILQAVLDHDQLVRSGRSPNEAIELMLTRIGVYDPLILRALAADVLASRRAATRELVVAD